MAAELSLLNIGSDLREALGDMLRRQHCMPGEAGHGACFGGNDLPDAAAGGTPNMIAAFLLLYALRKKMDAAWTEDLAAYVERMEAAADYLLSAQRPTGRIDLLDCNIDSPPDTAFSVIPICLGYEHLWACGFPAELQSLRVKLDQFLQAAAKGLIEGGVHTPNHRWVITSALLLLQRRFPDLAARPIANAYLAETFDINDEGFFIERSASVYDAVCDRSLFLIDWCIGHKAAREAALKNLRLDLQMLNEDGTIETGLSHRQDYGKRAVPSGLTSCYLRAYALTNDPAFLSAARGIYSAMKTPLSLRRDNEVAAVWLAHEYLLGLPEPRERVLNGAYLLRGTLHLEKAGYWRAGTDAYMVSCFSGRPHLLSFRAGEAELASLQIAQAYLGHGQFVADEMISGHRQLQLLYKGKHPGRLSPAYYKPLGREVPVEKWSEVYAQRETVPMPAPGGKLTIKLEDEGVVLEFLPDKIQEGTLGQIAFDFPPGGVWECDSCRVKPEAGQVMFLKEGFGRMSFGNDVIEIGPGCYGHGTWSMRDASGPGGCTRVLFTFRSPHPHKFFIRRAK